MSPLNESGSHETNIHVVKKGWTRQVILLLDCGTIVHLLDVEGNYRIKIDKILK